MNQDHALLANTVLTPTMQARAEFLADLIRTNGGHVPDLLNVYRTLTIDPDQFDSILENIQSAGVLLIEHDYLASDFWKCLQYLGFEIVYSETQVCFRIRNPNVKGWEKWSEIKPDKEGIERAARAKTLIARVCMHVVKEAGKYGKYKVVPIKAGAWGKGSELFAVLNELKGDTIPVISEYEDWVSEELRIIESMPQAEKDALIASLDSLFLNIPGVKPLTEDDAIVAKHCGKYTMAMIAHRLIQAHPLFKEGSGGPYARTIRPQREVAVICGEGDVGKSTFWANLIPKQHEFIRVGKISFGADTNKMGRSCTGNVMMIANELSKIRAASAATEAVKGFIAEDTITFDNKWEREKTIPMPCAFVATANEVTLPSDKQLRSRFVFFRLGVDESLDLTDPLRSCAETRGTAIANYCAAHRDSWLRAGMILAIENRNIQCPTDWDIMRERIIRSVENIPNDLHPVLERMVNEPRTWCSNGNKHSEGRMPAITPAELAWQAGLLKWPRDLLSDGGVMRKRAGTLIHPRSDREFVTFEDLQAAYAVAKREYRTLVDDSKAAFRAIGWTNKTASGEDVKRKKGYPMDDRAPERAHLLSCFVPPSERNGDPDLGF